MDNAVISKLNITGPMGSEAPIRVSSLPRGTVMWKFDDISGHLKNTERFFQMDASSWIQMSLPRGGVY